MEKKKQIGEHIVDHLSERMNEEIVDPVLDEWLAEDESNQEDFKRYKEIWKETGSYLEQETFNAQYAWDKIDRINKKRYNKRKRSIFLMTTFLYAFNPQLKSCKFFIPENLRAVALNNFVGIVLDNGSYLFFFQPDTRSYPSSVIIR